jgi:hypothetical protein
VCSTSSPGCIKVGRWLEHKLHIAFYRAVDERLIVRGVASEEPVSGWLFNTHYGRARVEGVYLNPALSANSGATEPTGSEADSDLSLVGQATKLP